VVPTTPSANYGKPHCDWPSTPKTPTLSASSDEQSPISNFWWPGHLMTKSEIPPQKSECYKFSRTAQDLIWAVLWTTVMVVLMGLSISAIAWIFTVYAVVPR